MYSVKLWLFCYTPELNLTSPVQKSAAAFRCVSTWPSVKHTSRNSDFRYVSSYFLFKARLEMVYSSGNAVTANLLIHSEFLDIYFYFTSCWLENLKKENSQLLVTNHSSSFFFFFLFDGIMSELLPWKGWSGELIQSTFHPLNTHFWPNVAKSWVTTNPPLCRVQMS